MNKIEERIWIEKKRAIINKEKLKGQMKVIIKMKRRMRTESQKESKTNLHPFKMTKNKKRGRKAINSMIIDYEKDDERGRILKS